MDARRVDQYTHAILTLTANMHRSHGVRAYILYIALGMLHLLIALYTANLTSAVLQEGRNNVKRSSCPSYRSVSEEGPSYRWGTSSQGLHDGFSRSRRGGSTIPSCCGQRARPGHAIRSFP
jgi:hypothetical protein